MPIIICEDNSSHFRWFIYVACRVFAATCDYYIVSITYIIQMYGENFARQMLQIFPIRLEIFPIKTRQNQ